MIKITRLVQNIFHKLSEGLFAHPEELRIYQDKSTIFQHEMLSELRSVYDDTNNCQRPRTISKLNE